MGQADGRVGGINALSTRPGGAENVNTNLIGINFYFNRIHFRQNGYRGCRGVNSSAAFGLGDALHAMHPTFVL